jgi:hypothetical protein
MTLPESLPARLYLLAYDTKKNRVTARSQLGLVLRAAALADLYLAGRVTDENGKVRSWRGWIAHGQPAVRTVRAQLEAGRIIRVKHRMILPDRVELLDRTAVARYGGELRAELRRPVSRIEPRAAAVLALAARGEIATVISRSERREHRQYLDELAVYTGPIADALRKAWQSKQAQQASA